VINLHIADDDLTYYLWSKTETICTFIQDVFSLVQIFRSYKCLTKKQVHSIEIAYLITDNLVKITASPSRRIILKRINFPSNNKHTIFPLISARPLIPPPPSPNPQWAKLTKKQSVGVHFDYLALYILYILSAELTKIHSFRLVFWAIFAHWVYILLKFQNFSLINIVFFIRGLFRKKDGKQRSGKCHDSSYLGYLH